SLERFGVSTRNTTVLPSGVTTPSSTGDSSVLGVMRSAGEIPSAACHQRLVTPARSLRNTTRLPLGDHSTRSLIDPPDVIRSRLRDDTVYTHTSVRPPSRIEKAIWSPSGAYRASPIARSPVISALAPFRSTSSGRTGPPPAAQTRSPFTDSAALT